MTALRTDILGAKISLGPTGNTPDEERNVGRIRALTFDPTSQGYVMLVHLDDGALVEAGLPGIGDPREVGAIKLLPEEPKSLVTPRELALEVALLSLGEVTGRLVGAMPAATDEVDVPRRLAVLGDVQKHLARAAELLGTKAW